MATCHVSLEIHSGAPAGSARNHSPQGEIALPALPPSRREQSIERVEVFDILGQDVDRTIGQLIERLLRHILGSRHPHFVRVDRASRYACGTACRLRQWDMTQDVDASRLKLGPQGFREDLPS